MTKKSSVFKECVSVNFSMLDRGTGREKIIYKNACIQPT